MDPASLAALIALMGAGSNLYSSSNAQSISQQGLAFQKQQALQANKLGTAGKTDAYGDTQTYDPATNTWVTTLSPLQKAISDATQSEQYKSLTTDAARNRAIKNMQYNAATEAGKDYNTNLAGFRYDQPASQGAIQDKLTTLMTNADNNAASSNESLAARTLLRQGRGGDLGNLVKTIQDNRGKALASDQLNAYTGSLNEKAALDQQHTSRYLPALQQAASTVAAGGGAPVNTSSIAPLLAQGQQQSAAEAMQAMLAGNKDVEGAYNSASKAAGQQLNLGQIGSLYSAFAKQPKSSSSSGGQAPEQYSGQGKGDGYPSIDDTSYGF